MGGNVLLDTNVVVAHFRYDPELTSRLESSPANFIPWIVLGELHYGACRAHHSQRQLTLIREFLDMAILLSLDEETCKYYGVVKSDLASRGCLIPDNDIWIAAIARQYDLPLVTRDAHFDAVKGLTVLKW
jgi:tRNA(fMet)-specific endonuclease VapC